MPSLSLFGLGGVIALGLGFGALVTTLQEHPAPQVQTYGATALAPAAAGPVETPPAPPPASVGVPSPESQPAIVAASLAAKPPARTRAPRAAKPAPAPAAVTPSPQQAWEQQRQAYEHAVAAYDANEKDAGYRWAQQNHIRVERYCRAAERRTPAFLQGCLGYARGEPPSGGAAG